MAGKLADRLPVILDLTVGNPEEDLKDQPGLLRLYKPLDTKTGTITRSADVCCPGCGSAVFHLPADRYLLVGDDHSLSCLSEIHFAVCCDTRWWLRDGEWVRSG